MKLSRRLDPDVARVFPPNTIQQTDGRLCHAARVLEEAHNRDDVAWVAESGKRLADEFAVNGETPSELRPENEDAKNSLGLILKNGSHA